MSPHAEAHPSPQIKCSGWLVWKEATGTSTSPCAATCYGISSTLEDVHIDLVQHHTDRIAPHGDAVLHSLSCLGSGVYQRHPDKTGTIPPPACLGLEFQRYRQAVMLPSSTAAAATHSHALQQQQQQHRQPASPARQDIELLHAQQSRHASTSLGTSSSSGDAYHGPAADPAGTSSSAPSTSPAGPEYHGRPSLVQRLQELHAEVSERLEGQDPLWFGKAFMARAAINLDSMKSMAGEVLDSIKADLGLQQKSEDTK